jgi:hypothetical protein
MFAFSWFPFLPREAAGHGITDPWVHQNIAKYSLVIWQDCPDEMRNHGSKDVSTFLDLPCFAKYDQGDDIIIGSGEEDHEKTPFCGPAIRCQDDNEGRNGFMEHFWNPDEAVGPAYNCIGDNTFNKGLVFTFPLDPFQIEYRYDSAYRLAQDLWDNKVIRFYREGKELIRQGNNEEGGAKIDEAYYWLGRVAHLLTDMTVPAHVHLLPHAPDLPLTENDPADCFEYYFDKNHPERINKYIGDPNIGPLYRFEDLPNLSGFNWQDVHSGPSNLFKLFWFTAQKTQYFASRSKDGYTSANGNPKYKTLSGEEREFNPPLWMGDPAVIISGEELVPGNEGKIADALIPHAIRAVAGLYRLFWFEANIIKWKYPIGTEPYQFAPVVDHNNIIYVPSGNNLLSINPNGTLKWSYPTSSSTVYTPSVAINGNIYFQTSDDGVYALDNNGSLLWKYKPAGYIGNGYVALDKDMTIYADITADGYYPRYGLHAIEASGKQVKWVFPGGGIPAIHPNGNIYSVWTSSDGQNRAILYSLNRSNGLPIWWKDVNLWHREPTIGPNGNIYVNCDSKLMAFSANGDNCWSYNNNGDWVSPPGISITGINNTIYFPSFSYFNNMSYIHAVNLNGSTKWMLPLGKMENMASSPLIDNNENILIRLNSGLMVLNHMGKLMWSLPFNNYRYSGVGYPVMGPDGTIFIIGYEQNNGQNYQFLYALRGSSEGLLGGTSAWPTLSTGPSKSSWPMEGANPQHTFRANLGVSMPYLHLLLAD